MKSYFLFSGSSHPKFAQEIASYLNTNLGQIHFEPFPDGELSLQILENVRNREVFVVQTIAKEPNNYLMELLIMIDALKRASAKSIIAVIPYFGYARQDRKEKPRVPITAKLVANLLTEAGANRVVTMDLHAGQIQGFFDIPVDHLLAKPRLCEAIAQLNLNNLVVLAPDLGAIKTARAYAEQLKADFALIDKRRIDTETVEVFSIIGNIAGKDVVLVDDMCSTGGTILMAAEACQKRGAKRIFAAFTHGLLIGNAVDRIEKSPIEKIFVSNTVPIPEENRGEKLIEISVAPIFGEALRCILSAESVSSLFS